MRFKVPQNVDIEDKIIGPLSGKQFLWMLGGAALLFLVYRFVDTSLFIAIAVIVMGISAAFAFIRPYGQSMISFLSHVFLYSTKGKQYVWRREKEPFKEKEAPQLDEELVIVKKEFPEKKVAELAEILDTSGETNFFDQNVFGKAPVTTVKTSKAPVGEQTETESEAQARLRNEERARAMASEEKPEEKLAQEDVDQLDLKKIEELAKEAKQPGSSSLEKQPQAPNNQKQT